jgi:D-alanyl-D-alanine carboxypeptidase
VHELGRVLGLAVVLLCASPSFADKVDDYVRAQVAKQNIPGLALAVVRGGKTVKLQGYGLANIEHGVPVTPTTVFQIGSVSKQFIASGIMVLARQGKLTLDDKIVQYLEGAPATWQDITIRQCLSHTSGLVRESPAYDWSKRQDDAVVIAAAYPAPLVFAPGTKFQYSNLGYFILGEIVRKTSGMPWPEFMAKRVFEPARLTTAMTTDASRVVPQRAAGYALQDGKQANAQLNVAVRPSGAFMASISDLARWEAVLQEDSILDEASRALMRQPMKLHDGSSAGYGLGWVVERVNGHALVRHGGTMNGFRAEFARFIDDDLAVIVLTNSYEASPDAIAAGVASRYIDGLIPKRVAIRLDAGALAKYAGIYEPGPAGAGHISVADGGLVLRWAMFARDIRAVPESERSFFIEDDPRTQLQFAVDDAGKVTHMAVLTNGTEQVRMPRSPQ